MRGPGTLRRLRYREDGVTSIEYGIIASLVAVVIIAAVSSVGAELDRTFSSVAAAFPQQQTDQVPDDEPNNFPDPCQEDDTNCGG